MSMYGGQQEPSLEEMLRQQASIPPEERCERCKGLGWWDVGCAIDRRIYWHCLNCNASGRKENSITEINKRLKENKS